MHRVDVVHRGDSEVLRAVGVEADGVVAYWWGWVEDGVAYEQLSFVLLDDSFVINQPVRFPPEQQGWWYCDLVAIERDGDRLTFVDRYIDVIVGPPDHPYRVLDLDEYADAVATGRLTPGDASAGLRQAQRFLDRRLNRRHDALRTWPDFPPAAVVPLLGGTDLPRDWSWDTA